MIGIGVQVRLVEEPYLRRTHGVAYTDYAARVGRFLPRLGRLQPDRHRHNQAVATGARDVSDVTGHP